MGSMTSSRCARSSATSGSTRPRSTRASVRRSSSAALEHAAVASPRADDDPHAPRAVSRGCPEPGARVTWLHATQARTDSATADEGGGEPYEGKVLDVVSSAGRTKSGRRSGSPRRELSSSEISCASRGACRCQSSDGAPEEFRAAVCLLRADRDGLDLDLRIGMDELRDLDHRGRRLAAGEHAVADLVD